MPTPNYGYEKRQKELAKKRKKEDKLRAKADRKVGGPEEGAQQEDASNAPQPAEGGGGPQTPQH